MKQYVVRGEKIGEIFFEAETNPLAEEWVEENTNEFDGKLTLYKLVEVCEWPDCGENE
jgi:hypothetical protein